ncbi:hypothetical protein [Streptomyces sp. NPDC059928]|uniref:hypothetical protein n=1 Tax=unclassified Streptomyces TaxID=2593676 RepID=UPI00365A58A0
MSRPRRSLPAAPEQATAPDLPPEALSRTEAVATPPASPPHPETDGTSPHPVDETRPLGRILLFGVQHVLVMAATPISAIFLMSATLRLNAGLTVDLLSAAFVLSGVGSLIQSVGLWKFGPRLPFVMLPGGAPLILFLAIADAHGLRVAAGRSSSPPSSPSPYCRSSHGC